MKATEGTGATAVGGSALSEGLGPLPDTSYVLAREGNGYEPDRLLSEAGYTADQMSAYAAQERAAERERCASLCELHSRLTWNDDRKAQSRVLAAEIRRGPT
jgi:hypothetical protein